MRVCDDMGTLQKERAAGKGREAESAVRSIARTNGIRTDARKVTRRMHSDIRRGFGLRIGSAGPDDGLRRPGRAGEAGPFQGTNPSDITNARNARVLADG